MSDRPLFRPMACPTYRERAPTHAPYLSLPLNVPHKLVLASPKLLGLPLHFRHGRSLLCREQFGQCDLCKEDAWAWYGFALVLVCPSGEVNIFSIPEPAYMRCKKLVEGEGRLRGLIIDAQRKGKNDAAPVHVSVREEVYGKDLPPLPDLRSCLAKRYGVQLEWGC